MDSKSIIEKIYLNKAYKDVCRNIATPDLYEDLFHETIVTMLEMASAKIEDANAKGYIKFLFVKIAHNSFNSKHSPFYRKYRHNDINDSIEPILNLSSNYDNHLEESENEIEEFTIGIEADLNELDWYEGTLLKLYIDIGDIKKVSNMVGIKYGAVYYTIQKAIKKIKLKNDTNYQSIIDNFNN